MTDQQSALFVGLGSPHGDDQLGWRVADYLATAKDLPPQISVRKAAIPLDLLDWLEGISLLALCDAVETSSQVGTLERWEWNRDEPATASETNPSPQSFLPMFQRSRTASSHDFELSEVLDLARKLDRLPGRIVIWAISAKQFESGQGISAELEKLLPAVSAQIQSELTRMFS